MRSSPAAMAHRSGVTAFQRKVLAYCEMHKRVAATPEHAFRMGVPLRNLQLAIQLLRAMRMLALDPTLDGEQFGLTARGKEELSQ